MGAIQEIVIDEGLGLRALRLEDAAKLYDLVDANRGHLGAWLGWVQDTTCPEQVGAYIRASLQGAAVDKATYFGVVWKGDLVGCCELKDLDIHHGDAELGYWLAGSCTGQGIMTRSIRALVGYAFLELRVRRVRLLAATHNLASRSIAERLGFKHEGVEHEAMLVNGKSMDQEAYSLSLDESTLGRLNSEPRGG